MSKEKDKDKKSKKIVLPIIVLVMIIIIMCVILIMAKSGKLNKKEEITILTSSTLKETVDIAELSTSKYTFNGIATVYNKKKTEKVDCQIKYKSTVKASIDMKKIDFEVREEEKIVNVLLPEITITPTLVTEDKESFSFIPEGTNLELKDVIEICKKDAEEEAKKSEKLLQYAEENLKDTIEALILPNIEKYGYRITWNEEFVENEMTNEVEVVNNETP